MVDGSRTVIGMQFKRGVIQINENTSQKFTKIFDLRIRVRLSNIIVLPSTRLLADLISWFSSRLN